METIKTKWTVLKEMGSVFIVTGKIKKLFFDLKIDLRYWAFLISISYNNFYEVLYIDILCFGLKLYMEDSFWNDVMNDDEEGDNK